MYNYIMGNASGSLNGWAFQVASGILIFFSKIKDIAKIKMEGPSEDIEITFNDGNKLLCQAKSVLSINDRTNVTSNYKKAFASLYKNKNNGQTFRYVTNIPDPLNSDNKFFYEKHYGLWNFNTLPANDQTKIKKEMSDDFNFNNLFIQYIDFFGDDDSTRYSVILDSIKDFCTANCLDNSYAKRILDSYQFKFINSGITYLEKSKKDFIMPLVVVTMDSYISINTILDLGLFDISFFEIASNKYRDFISNHLNDYEFLVKFLSDYCIYQKTKGDFKSFILNKWNDYINDFPNDDINIQEALIKIFLYKVITQRSNIKNIFKGAGL